VLRVFAGLNRADELLDYSNRYLQLTRESRTEAMEAVALRYRGHALLHQGMFEDAKRSLDEAVSKSEDLGSKLELGRALQGRSHVWQALGEVDMGAKDHSRAQSIFDECGVLNGYNLGGVST
jgi:hypothetical protein